MNNYWRNVAGRTLISREGREYRDSMVRAAVAGKFPSFPDGPVQVRITACPPDRRRRDLDNMLKPMLDALTHVKVWSDDSQIDDLRIVRGLPVKGGLMTVEVSSAV
jgi:crossover junction endodeoxyribonuclease RusA